MNYVIMYITAQGLTYVKHQNGWSLFPKNDYKYAPMLFSKQSATEWINRMTIGYYYMMAEEQFKILNK